MLPRYHHTPAHVNMSADADAAQEYMQRAAEMLVQVQTYNGTQHVE